MSRRNNKNNKEKSSEDDEEDEERSNILLDKVLPKRGRGRPKGSKNKNPRVNHSKKTDKVINENLPKRGSVKTRGSKSSTIVINNNNTIKGDTLVNNNSTNTTTTTSSTTRNFNNEALNSIFGSKKYVQHKSKNTVTVITNDFIQKNGRLFSKAPINFSKVPRIDYNIPFQPIPIPFPDPIPLPDSNPLPDVDPLPDLSSILFPNFKINNQPITIESRPLFDNLSNNSNIPILSTDNQVSTNQITVPAEESNEKQSDTSNNTILDIQKNNDNDDNNISSGDYIKVINEIPVDQLVYKIKSIDNNLISLRIDSNQNDNIQKVLSQKPSTPNSQREFVLEKLSTQESKDLSSQVKEEFLREILGNEVLEKIHESLKDGDKEVTITITNENKISDLSQVNAVVLNYIEDKGEDDQEDNILSELQDIPASQAYLEKSNKSVDLEKLNSTQLNKLEKNSQKQETFDDTSTTSEEEEEDDDNDNDNVEENDTNVGDTIYDNNDIDKNDINNSEDIEIQINDITNKSSQGTLNVVESKNETPESPGKYDSPNSKKRKRSIITPEDTYVYSPEIIFSTYDDNYPPRKYSKLEESSEEEEEDEDYDDEEDSLLNIPAGNPSRYKELEESSEEEDSGSSESIESFNSTIKKKVMNVTKHKNTKIDDFLTKKKTNNNIIVNIVTSQVKNTKFDDTSVDDDIIIPERRGLIDVNRLNIKPKPKQNPKPKPKPKSNDKSWIPKRRGRS